MNRDKLLKRGDRIGLYTGNVYSLNEQNDFITGTLANIIAQNKEKSYV